MGKGSQPGLARYPAHRAAQLPRTFRVISINSTESLEKFEASGDAEIPFLKLNDVTKAKKLPQAT